MNQLEIWKETQQKLKHFIFRQVRDHALTDDIVQDVFLKVHARIGQLKDSQKITGWIFQIARNTIIDHFRKQARPIEFADFAEETNHETLKDCVVTCLQETMATLPVKYREVLELTEMNDLSQLQLAERLQISYSGAKSRVQRARQLLKDKMDEQYKIKFDRYGNVLVCENKMPCCQEA